MIKTIRCFLVLAFLALAVVVSPVSALAQTFSVLYNFNNSANSTDPLDFVFPGTLAQGQNGNIFTTSANGGGTFNSGTVFTMTPTGGLSELLDFANICDAPSSGLTLGTDGNFYGTLQSCTNGNAGQVFKITLGGNLTSLYNFTGGADGGDPTSNPVEGTDSNFYGTTLQGGGTSGCGTIYKITPSGTLTTLHQFDRTDGCASYGPLVQGTDGSFYGTTSVGGAANFGIVFKITSSGKYTVLYNFDLTHGATPLAPLMQGSDGNFYGTCSQGGAGEEAGGVIFRIAATGRITVLHTFNATSGDGWSPSAGLVQATDGKLYGVTQSGGTSLNGTIFRIGLNGSAYAIRHSFDGTTGSQPEITLLQHTNGLLFGLSMSGGTYGAGTFYDLNEGMVPFVSLLPSSGKVASKVEILGQGLTGATSVSFNGTTANFKVLGDTYMTATVPSGAMTGSVQVITPGGTLTSNKIFRVTPQLLSFSPPSGPVGTLVTITGVSLTQTEGVGFGDYVPAKFTVNSDTQVTATVPTGAKTGPVGIETQGGIAVSSTKFRVTQ